MSGRRILLTGGAGFLGLHLATRLADEEGAELVLVDDLSRGRRDAALEALLARREVRLVTGDLTEPATLARAGTGFDEVYHLAAVLGVQRVLAHPYETLRVNALATLRVLDWLGDGGGRRLVFASTSEAYAWTMLLQPLPVPTPEDVPLALGDLRNPRVAYAGSKIHGELLVTQRCQACGVPFTILRYHNVYGPRMGDEHVVPQLAARIRAGQDPLVVYAADHRRAFCHVSDAVEATILAMRAPGAAGATINVGDPGGETSIGDLARLMLRLAGRPERIAPADAPHDAIARRVPDIARARALLGYAPRTPLADGLLATMRWYASTAAPAPAAGSVA